MGVSINGIYCYCVKINIKLLLILLIHFIIFKRLQNKTIGKNIRI